jgi:Tol biopolymer transport system component
MEADRFYIINADGSGLHPLLEGEYPAWSPKSNWIAFRSDRGGAWAIWVMRSDGSNLRKVVDAPVLPLWFWEKIAWRP